MADGRDDIGLNYSVNSEVLAKLNLGPVTNVPGSEGNYRLLKEPFSKIQIKVAPFLECGNSFAAF